MAKTPYKKPTAAQLIQKLEVQVAELRGRVEKLEASRAEPVYIVQDSPPTRTWGEWLRGGPST